MHRRYAYSFWNYLRRPSRDTLIILERMNQMDQSIADLTASIDTFITNVEKLIEQHKTDVAKAIADAIAADDAAEGVDLAALKAKIEAANAKLVVPPFEPSNQ